MQGQVNLSQKLVRDLESSMLLLLCKNTSPYAELVCDSDSSIRESKAESQKARTFAKSLKASYTDSSAPALYFPDGKFIFPQLLAVGQAASGRSALIARPEAKCCGEDFCLAVIHFQMQRERQNHSALRGLPGNAAQHMLCPFFSASSVGNKKQNPFPHRHLFIVILRLLFSNFGSQVSSMPSLRNSQISTEDSITDVWAWQPFNRGSCSKASPASGLLAALTESAIRVSSVCRRGFCCRDI